MNEAETRAEQIAPLFAAAGWGEVENHFVEVSKMVWIGNGLKIAKLECVQSNEACYMQEEERSGETVAETNTSEAMNEAETRAEHIDPALKAAGWGAL